MSWKNALEGCPHSVLHDCRRVPWKEGFTGVSQKRGFKQCFAAASHKWVPQRTLKRICYTDLLWCAFGFMDKCKHIWFPPHPKQVDPQTCDPGWHGSFHNKRTGMSQPASALDRFLAKLIQLQWQPLTTGSKWSMRHDRPPGCTTNGGKCCRNIRMTELWTLSSLIIASLPMMPLMPRAVWQRSMRICKIGNGLQPCCLWRPSRGQSCTCWWTAALPAVSLQTSRARILSTVPRRPSACLCWAIPTWFVRCHPWTGVPGWSGKRWRSQWNQ